MEVKDLYEQLLGYGVNWRVSLIDSTSKPNEVHVYLEYLNDKGVCPETGETCPIYDFRPERIWRHLDSLQYRTFLHARLPRVKNAAGKVISVSFPWADSSDRHTFLLQTRVIETLQATKNQTKTAELFGLSFDSVHLIMRKAVARGLSRRHLDGLEAIALDEKSYSQGHKYLTVLSDPLTNRVLDVVEGRKMEDAEKVINQTFNPEELKNIKAASMDMWQAFMGAVKKLMPTAKIVHDKFHLFKYLSEAIDKTRRREAKKHDVLKSSRWALLKYEINRTQKQQTHFEQIDAMNLSCAKAWRLREDFKALYGQKTFKEFTQFLNEWLDKTSQIGSSAMYYVGEMIRKHREGVENYFHYPLTNARAERLNASIQELKFVAKGYRNMDNFRIAILFFNGQLQLLPLKCP